MTRKEILEFFARRDEVWQRHDAAALAADHAEDGVVDSPFYGKVVGRSALLSSYSQWFLSFPDAHYSTEHLLVDRNKAAQFIKMTGTQKGDFCGLAPTGKRFEMNCAFMFYFADNKIAHEIRVYDFTGILVQLGVLKAKPAF
ncbi:MAG: ester cyclase [Acidobacteria bacterium]|nr:ester cyclase [Acidobacteriota bacterium]